MEEAGLVQDTTSYISGNIYSKEENSFDCGFLSRCAVLCSGCMSTFGEIFCLLLQEDDGGTCSSKRWYTTTRRAVTQKIKI